MPKAVPLDGPALIYCEGALAAPSGKTAHGLIRRTSRYQVVGVLDTTHAGADAGAVIDGVDRDIAVYADLRSALSACTARDQQVTHFVIGLAPDGGRLAPEGRAAVLAAIDAGLNVDSGLHDFLSDDPEIARRAQARGVLLRDVRRPPPRAALHFFCGTIERVDCLKVAVLGTDSAVGKRTTAWEMVDGLRARGKRAELIGTGQTAWMQGARYGIVLDALVNDFVAGEIEHAVVSCYDEVRPDVIVVEGQGSLMNPAYPGGYEILAAARPDAVVLQHAPARRFYDGFPGYPIHPLKTQMSAIELVSGRPVIAIAVNHEAIAPAERAAATQTVRLESGLPTCDVLTEGPDALVGAVLGLSARKRKGLGRAPQVHR
jgi:uncharacterized NAD-dependent epimerase/dehydratase family protein